MKTYLIKWNFENNLQNFISKLEISEAAKESLFSGINFVELEKIGDKYKKSYKILLTQHKKEFAQILDEKENFIYLEIDNMEAIEYLNNLNLIETFVLNEDNLYQKIDYEMTKDNTETMIDINKNKLDYSDIRELLKNNNNIDFLVFKEEGDFYKNIKVQGLLSLNARHNFESNFTDIKNKTNDKMYKFYLKTDNYENINLEKDNLDVYNIGDNFYIKENKERSLNI